VPLTDEPQRISGKVSGMVNGVEISDVDLHSYVVTNDGRTYTAISRIPDRIGYSLQSLYAVGSILGFLFALPQQPMLHNGFVLTGACFTRFLCDWEIEFNCRTHLYLTLNNRDLEILVTGHSRFFKLVPFESLGSVSSVLF